MNNNLHDAEISEEPACDYQQSQTFSRETFEALLALKSALEQQGVTTPIGGSQVFEHVLQASESIEHEAVQQARTRLLNALLPDA
ncbi:MAG: hypothetical protein ETSY1_11675 [Candidatus Entotheonella factor]|uniref:Uncharacterized protein n=1 Tax=Entotheonella factor TaxID=1429438 RepID=W4LRH7_ENTF1|nr:hypothetical protein [Candidatus Entotheonella palauensis]ETX00311.1 MAG: hypothetical protein ETSY1_11675 [Candidatus Entotheonella factor]